jgi:pyrroloquinoline quinone biosynthesis protein B
MKIMLRHCLFILSILNFVIAFSQNPYVVVLGIAQDGGYPQAGCKKECCKAVWENPLSRQMVSCIALVDPISNEKWIFDASPDFTQQQQELNKITKNDTDLNGIFLTHAHIGHYTGLMYLGRETMGAKKTKVFAMPKMKSFLEQNGPWSQLVKLENIDIQEIAEEKVIILNERISVIAFRVPHRDEFSETVGYKIIFNNKALIFIPDIDKWQNWNKDLVKLVKENDYLLLDGTFYKDGEINRPMSEVPHPFVSETIELLKDLEIQQKNKVYFIHLNHTNPLLKVNSKERKKLKMAGFNVASQKQKIEF